MIGAGTVLAGRYRLEQRIASGGMGEVWRGFDQTLSRTVAVKCLRTAPVDEPAFANRIRAEARIAATISHPGVVEVYDLVDDPAAGVFLVMQYVDGESLAQALAREGRLSPAATMRLVAEAAEALHAAHEKGVTHRDVKPGNLLLRPDGSVVLTDFGIARAAGATGHTTTGTLLGTAGYIAPERAHAQPATPRSDIYALGVVAYRCLAGHPPFTGDSVVELALSHVRDEPPPLPADVPPAVRSVVERAMAKDPADRWPSGAALAAAARRAMGQLPGGVGPGPTRAVAPAPTRRQTTAPDLDPPVTGGRGGRGMLVAGAAAVAIVIIATVAIVLTRGTDRQAQSPAVDPSSPSGAGSVGTSSPTPPASPTASASPSAGSAPTSPAAGGPGTPPAAPTNLTAIPVGPNTIRLQWTDNSADEDGFTIINGVTSRDVGADTTTHEWTGLAAGTYSCFKIRAFNSSGVSPYYPAAELDWVCTTSLPGVGPAAPSGLTAKPVDSGTIRLQWTDNSADEDGFTIYNGVTWRDVGADTETYDWGGLAPGTYMCFKIRSRHLLGVSAYHPADPDWVCTTTPTT